MHREQPSRPPLVVPEVWDMWCELDGTEQETEILAAVRSGNPQQVEEGLLWIVVNDCTQYDLDWVGLAPQIVRCLERWWPIHTGELFEWAWRWIELLQHNVPAWLYEAVGNHIFSGEDILVNGPRILYPTDSPGRDGLGVEQCLIAAKCFAKIGSTAKLLDVMFLFAKGQCFDPWGRDELRDIYRLIAPESQFVAATIPRECRWV
jgi:hypothetical protein